MVWLTSFLGLSMISILLLVYLIYFFVVCKNSQSISKFNDNLFSCQNSKSEDPVSIIVNTYNESKVIGRKLDNIGELDYPKKKIEVLVIDDSSNDGTGEIAKRKIKELNISVRVIRTKKRLGLNRSLNLAMETAKHNFICITDSDVVLEKNALKNAVNVLKTFKGAGGVTGKLQPFFEKNGLAQTNEKVYRELYDRSMLGESSIHSSFPGNGTLIVFDKSKVPFAIPVDYGATDANIAMNIIKSGYRFVYVPNAIILEHVAENVGGQKLQKIRRAKRLIQVFLHNLDVFFNKKYGDFGTRVFPLKFLMVTLCPVLFFSGLFLLTISVLMMQNFALYIFLLVGFLSVANILLVFKNLRGKISSFIFHQFYLFAGLISSVRKSLYWKNIERK